VLGTDSRKEVRQDKEMRRAGAGVPSRIRTPRVASRSLQHCLHRTLHRSLCRSPHRSLHRSPHCSPGTGNPHTRRALRNDRTVTCTHQCNLRTGVCSLG